MAEREDETVITEVECLILKTMKTKLQHLEKESEASHTICRVLPLLRDQHNEDYEPKIISIGPLHAGKKRLEPMEHLKWRYLQDLLSRCGQQDMLAKYIKKVSELEAQARKRYAEAVEPDSDAFIQTMVLDACFIIEMLIQSECGATRRYRAHEVPWCLPLLWNDLILLENQIPFFIVQSLFKLSNIPDVPDLEKLAISYVTSGKSMSIPGKEDPKKAHHLLHLFLLSIYPTPIKEITTAPSCGHMVMNAIKKIGSMSCLIRLLALFRRSRQLPLKCSKCHQQQLTNEERLRSPTMIPSATDLEEHGAVFKRKEEAMSLLDVTFRDGVMEIPLLIIEDETVPQFRNLMAFEQCCPTSGDHFTSYAAFIDNLINTPKDVAILKKCGIIESLLGRDEEVADLFNSLGKHAYLNVEKHYLAQLFKDVKQYSEVNRHTWRARLMRDYFATPWSTISVIAAIILLILTVVQAIYAILAYHKPPK